MKSVQKISGLIAVFISLTVQAGVIVPEFLVTTEGETLADKRNVSGSCNSEGQLALAWLDYRDAGQWFGDVDWVQTYVQYIDASGVPQGGNVHLDLGSDFRYCAASASAALYDDGKALVATTREDKVDSWERYENAVIRLWDTDAGFESQPEAEFELGLKMPVLAPYGNRNCLAVQNTPSFFDPNPIEVQRFTRTGEILGDPVLVDSGEVKSVIVDSQGAFAIAYTPFNGPCYYRRYDENSNPAGERAFVDSTPGPFSVAGTPDGTLLCAWCIRDLDDNYDIYVQRFSASDQPVGSPELILNTANAPLNIVITRGAVSNYLLVYYLSGSDTVYGQFFDMTGTPQGGAFAINETGNGETIRSVWAGASEDSYQVSWIQDENVYVREVTFDGMLREQLRVCDDEPGVHAEWNEPVLTPDGDFYVHWIASDYSKEIRHYTSNGNPDGGAWGSDSLKGVYPALGLDGRLYVSYFTTDELGVENVWVQRFHANGLPDGTPMEIGQCNASVYNSMAVSVGDDGEGVVVWEEEVDPWRVWLWGQLFDVDAGLIGEPFQIDSFYSRRALEVSKFADGGFVIASNQTKDGEYMGYLFDSDGNLEKGPFWIDGVTSTIQSNKSFACNGVDRFVTTCMAVNPDTIYVQVHDRDGNRVGETYSIVLPYYDENTNKMTYLMREISPAVAMVPDGRFVVTWKELDASGNLNLWAQLFSADGEPISAPFQVNDADQWEYSFQISGWRGVSCNNERILFTWLENRRHRGWDVIAKVTDWDFATITEDPAIEHGNVELISPIGPEIVLRYHDCPEGFHAHVYDPSGRLVDELHSSQTEGTISWGESHGHGVYFIKSFEGRGEVYKVVLVR